MNTQDAFDAAVPDGELLCQLTSRDATTVKLNDGVKSIGGQAFDHSTDADAAVMGFSQAGFFRLIVFSDALHDRHQRFYEVEAVRVSVE